jgi:hypothetical protein
MLGLLRKPVYGRGRVKMKSGYIKYEFINGWTRQDITNIDEAYIERNGGKSLSPYRLNDWGQSLIDINGGLTHIAHCDKNGKVLASISFDEKGNPIEEYELDDKGE